MELNVKAFSITCGMLWSIGLFLLTWWFILFDGTTYEVTIIGRMYRGYSISPMGSVFGLLWALADGLIGGAIFAWTYNLIVKKLTK